jgi:ATP-binding cassette subfamily B (MDR/TAP) protein 1
MSLLHSYPNYSPVEFFDRDENSAGGLTSTLSDNPQKVNGLAGVTLGA